MSNQLFPVATQKITNKSGDSSILLLANYTEDQEEKILTNG